MILSATWSPSAAGFGLLPSLDLPSRVVRFLKLSRHGNVRNIHGILGTCESNSRMEFSDGSRVSDFSKHPGHLEREAVKLSQFWESYELEPWLERVQGCFLILWILAVFSRCAFYQKAHFHHCHLCHLCHLGHLCHLHLKANLSSPSPNIACCHGTWLATARSASLCPTAKVR